MTAMKNNHSSKKGIIATGPFVLFALLFASLAITGYSAPAFGATVRWTGGGRTDKASDSMNWNTGKAPEKNDYVLFGIRSSKNCDWDLNIKISSFAMTTNYRGKVRLLSSSLKVIRTMNIEGGSLDLQKGSLNVGRRIYIGYSGTLELSDATLRVGPAGILVDGGGTLLSTGNSKASVKPMKSGAYYKFIVGRGKVTLSNPAGTDVEGSQGMTIYSFAEVARADFVNVKRIKPGESALRLFRAQGQKLEPKGWTFDETVEKKIGMPDAGLEKSELAAMAVEARTPEEDQPVAAPVNSLPVPPEGPASAAIEAGVPGYDQPAAESSTPQQPPAPGPLDVPPPEAPAAAEPEEIPFAGLAEYETASARANFLPYLAVQFNGGQHFLQSEQGNLSGNLNLLASVVIKHAKLGPNWAIVPVVSSQYQGTKQVTDLVGGGTLFQERMAHSLAVRGVYQLSPEWKLKPGVGYKWEFLKETKDETWGHGLFDYRRPSFSLEGEYVYSDPFSFTIGYDFYRIGFVNFSSLESIIKDSQGDSMARELSGRSVLDSDNHSLALGGTLQGPWRSYAEGNLVTTLRLFPDQHVVNQTGDFNNSTRNDISNQLSLAWRIPREISAGWKALGGLRLAAGYNKSNQNSYDAQKTRYLENYYDSTSLRAGVDLGLSRKLKGDRPMEFNLSATLGRVGYSGRLAQDSSGLYLSDKIYQNEAVLSLSVNYPVAPHFVWTSQFGYGRQASNQNFERLYRYNFTTTNYRLGFGYEF